MADNNQVIEIDMRTASSSDGASASKTKSKVDRVGAWRSRVQRNKFVSGRVGFVGGVIWRFAMIALCIGLFMVVFGKNFSFGTFMSGLMQENLSPFDFNTVVTEISNWFDDWPSWLIGFQVLCEPLVTAVVSVAYIVASLFMLIGYIGIYG